MSMTRFITDRQIYEEVLLRSVPGAEKYLWIGTSDIKDLYFEKRKRMIPFLEVLADLCAQGVSVRLIHAKEPGPRFRTDFDKYPVLVNKLERLLCPRVHFKCVVIDGRVAYSGSANLTGSGMGAKSSLKRNFESGILTEDKEMIKAIMEQFDAVWMGAHCNRCGRKDFCAEYSEMN